MSSMKPACSRHLVSDGGICDDRNPRFVIIRNGVLQDFC